MPGTGASPCPSCGQPVWPGDKFCESCRADLTVAASGAAPGETPPPAGTGPGAAAASAAAAGPVACPGCGSTAFSPEGYCEACGRKRPAPRDHVETDLGRLAGVTDRGLRHSRNEDAMALAAVAGSAGPVSVAVVCDGVSGSDRGDEASEAGVQAALTVLAAAAEAGDDPGQASLRAAREAQTAVAELNRRPETTAPTAILSSRAASAMTEDAPSATYVSAVVTPAAVTVCWLGDSRAYWLDAADPAAARRLTTDDSLATRMIEAGVLSEAEAMASAQAHVVTGWLGADVSGTKPHLVTFTPEGPGVVLVCSDGLWNYLPDPAALAGRALPGASTDLLGTARTLVEFALEAGGHDNITVVLAPFPPRLEEPRQGEMDNG